MDKAHSTQSHDLTRLKGCHLTDLTATGASGIGVAKGGAVLPADLPF